MHILLTNDDGILAPGLLAAYAALKARGHELTVCAPDIQRSGASQSMTFYRPIRVAPRTLPDGGRGFAVSGTPADCASLGLTTLAGRTVDMLVSGLNDDFNLGFDVNYSGTLSAALEAAALGCPALAASVERMEPYDWPLAGQVLAEAVERLPAWRLPPGVAVNLNIPARPAGDWFWTRPQATPYDCFYAGEPQPDGSTLYRHRRKPDPPIAPDREPDNDVEHAARGRVTLSPITLRGCHEEALTRLTAAGRP